MVLKAPLCKTQSKSSLCKASEAQCSQELSRSSHQAAALAGPMAHFLPLASMHWCSELMLVHFQPSISLILSVQKGDRRALLRKKSKSETQG